MSKSTFVASLVITTSLVTSSIAATVTVSKQEVELAVACINATHVGTAGAAAAPLALRDALTAQAQEQLSKDAQATTLKLEISDEQTNLLLVCIQNAAVPNAAAAEAPLALAKKIVTQYNAAAEKEGAQQTKKK